VCKNDPVALAAYLKHAPADARIAAKKESEPETVSVPKGFEGKKWEQLSADELYRLSVDAPEYFETLKAARAR
jgi:hypothetical protein